MILGPSAYHAAASGDIVPTMCGIAGILRVHPPGTAPPPPELAIPESWLDILDESIKHRGPDGQGRFRDRAVRADGSVVDVALVHRRLSIIDHKDGHQPMVSMGGPTVREGARTSDPRNDLVAVVFNGCIYNHRELRKELTAAGHLFVTDHSDTEVLIHGWREWGEALPVKLDAMFAWAIWDSRNATLILARDRSGEKPLYITDRIGPPYTIAFASTPAAFPALGFPPDPRALRPGVQRMHRFTMHNWIRYGRFKYSPVIGVGMVDPGHFAMVGSPLLRRQQAARKGQPAHYVEKNWRPKTGLRNWHPPLDRFDELLSSAVASRLEADVPIGCFLSGGIDSSLISAYARKHRPDVSAFTVRMPSAGYDESSRAQAVARHLGIPHEVLECRLSPAEDLVHLIRQLGLPFGDSSILPTYWLSKAAAEHVKVALSGDGGDELFAGYERYRAAHYLGFLGPFRHVAWPLLPFLAEDADPKSRATRLSRFFNAAAREGYADLTSIFPQPMISRLGAPAQLPLWGRALITTVQLLFEVLGPLLELTSRAHVAGVIGSDLRLYLPEDILRKTDTASMAVPLEVRAPFLAREVYDAATQTRISHLMPRGQLKGLLKNLAARYIPRELIDRPKQGFAIPIGDWFRTDYGGMKTLLMDHLDSTEPWGSASLGIDLNMKFVRQMLDEHMNQKRDHSQRLYMLLVLSIWAQGL